MDLIAISRLLLVYLHLLLCVFALQSVLSTDARVLRERIDSRSLLLVHRRLVRLLGGLWLSGLAIAAIDLGFDASLIANAPKTIGKLCAVGVLTANGLLLRHWCLPRLAGPSAVGSAEYLAIMVCGAVSTASWLMAAFFGVARPLQQWSAAACVSLYVAVLVLATAAALMLGVALRRSSFKRRLGSGFLA